MKNQKTNNIYVSPECEYVNFDSADIITASPLGSGLFGLPNLEIGNTDGE